VAAEGISRFLKLVLIINVARVLGATEYGKFDFALSFIFILAIFSDFGVSSIATRELSKGKENEDEYPSIFSLKIILSFCTFILILIGSFLITQDLIIQKLIRILAVYAIATNFNEIIYVFFRARQIMEYEALARIIQAVLVTGIGLLVILQFASIESLGFSYVFATLFVSFLLLFFFHFKIYSLTFSFRKLIWKKFISMSWPLGLGTVFSYLSVLVGPVIMGYFNLITEVGLYGAAGKIISILVLPALIIVQSFYPMLSKAFKESKEAFQKIFYYQIQLIVFIFAPLMVGAMTLAPKIIDFIYGSDFFLSVPVFKILIPAIGFVYLNSVFSQILVVINEQKRIIMVSFCVAIASVILNLILIPMASLYGASLSVLIATILNFLLLLGFSLKLAPIKPLNFKVFISLIGYVFSSILMYFALSFSKVYDFNIFISILLGGSIYLIFVFLYKKLIKHIITC